METIILSGALLLFIALAIFIFRAQHSYWLGQIAFYKDNIQQLGQELNKLKQDNFNLLKLAKDNQEAYSRSIKDIQNTFRGTNEKN